MAGELLPEQVHDEEGAGGGRDQEGGGEHQEGGTVDGRKNDKDQEVLQIIWDILNQVYTVNASCLHLKFR